MTTNLVTHCEQVRERMASKGKRKDKKKASSSSLSGKLAKAKVAKKKPNLLEQELDKIHQLEETCATLRWEILGEEDGPGYAEQLKQYKQERRERYNAKRGQILKAAEEASTVPTSFSAIT
eukprot:m.33150 g.33150  ORF g.33150 m.33150 type:complete len:121 (+) comp9585_c0_seq2:63-425(+)